MEERAYKVKSLHKGMTVLECFLTDPVLSVTDISERLSLYKSNVSDILATFREMGYVEQDQESGKYRLGMKLLSYAQRISADMGIVKTAYPYIQALALELGETVYIGMIHGTEVIYLDGAFPTERYTYRSMLGIRASVYSTAIGKSMLSHLPEEEWAAHLPQELSALTDYTHTDYASLREDLILSRERGYSLDLMENEFGIKCVGVAVLGRDRRPVAGISISGPSLRFDDDHIALFAARLRETAEQLSSHY